MYSYAIEQREIDTLGAVETPWDTVYTTDSIYYNATKYKNTLAGGDCG